MWRDHGPLIAVPWSASGRLLNCSHLPAWVSVRLAEVRTLAAADDADFELLCLFRDVHGHVNSVADRIESLRSLLEPGDGTFAGR